tara:strand:+ start:5533 stop:5817 length:285 start_codon:yes stop_codon:yes gene_type:complete
MGFNDKLKRILDKEKPKMLTKSCTNFWCKVRFEVSDRDLENYPEFYSTCPKCRSFDKDLSGGVINNGQREYAGERFDGEEHEVTVREYKSGFHK